MTEQRNIPASSAITYEHDIAIDAAEQIKEISINDDVPAIEEKLPLELNTDLNKSKTSDVIDVSSQEKSVTAPIKKSRFEIRSPEFGDEELEYSSAPPEILRADGPIVRAETETPLIPEITKPNWLNEMSKFEEQEIGRQNRILPAIPLKVQGSLPAGSKVIHQRSSSQDSSLESPQTADNYIPKGMSSVTGVVFKTNPIIDELRRCLHLVEQNDPNFTLFNVKDCKSFSNKYALLFCEALQQNTNLLEIRMSGVGLSNSAGIELSKALLSNKSVKIVDVQYNNIGPMGVTINN